MIMTQKNMRKPNSTTFTQNLKLETQKFNYFIISRVKNFDSKYFENKSKFSRSLVEIHK